MFVLGITGGIGSGKSTAAAHCVKYGFKLLDADKISQELMSRKSDLTAAVAERFGRDCLNEAGGVINKVLAEKVFKSKDLVAELGKMTHGAILAEMGKRMNRYADDPRALVCLDVPIPVEDGFINKCDLLLVISCPDEIRIKRLLKRGLSAGDAERRIAVQLSNSQYEALADHVIVNDGDSAEFEEKLDIFLEKELEARGLLK